MTPKQLLAIVCKYYGIKSIKGLATSVQLSFWRYLIIEEARMIGCFLIQKHCALSAEEVAAALEKQLPWRSGEIRAYAAAACRKLSENAAFRLSGENIEQMVIASMMKSGRTLNRKKEK